MLKGPPEIPTLRGDQFRWQKFMRGTCMNKFESLKRNLRRLGKVVVAYSGGLDSTFLLKVAIDTLGRENVIAVTARSETYPMAEYKEARSIAERLGARHITINTNELAIQGFKDNPVDRCYYCKKELFKKLDVLRKKYNMAYLLDGTNFDDLKDVRYGRKAAKELGVRSPLLEAGLGKSDIRTLSRKMNLPTWDKPSFACLASRFPFHSTISRNGLARVGSAEEFLRAMGIKQFRVRSHGDIARIEVLPSDFSKLIANRNRVSTEMKKLGFVYVAMDLSGYRTGSMHESEK